MSDSVKIGRTEDFPSGQGKVVDVNGKSIAVFNIDGFFFALDNTCLHRGGPIGDGEVEGTSVTCPWHGWRYDIKTGQTSFNPDFKLNTYEVTVEGEEISIQA